MTRSLIPHLTPAKAPFKAAPSTLRKPYLNLAVQGHAVSLGVLGHGLDGEGLVEVGARGDGAALLGLEARYLWDGMAGERREERSCLAYHVD